MIRHLLMHIYPRRHGGRWRRSVAHLLAGYRWGQLTGRKLISVATDECCDRLADVRDAFGPRAAGIEFHETANEPGLQEVVSFGRLLRQLGTCGPDEIALYAHAKGCTHADHEAPSHKWLDAMAAACLDYPPLIDCAFATCNIAGAFRVLSGWGFPGYHDWHFAGTWYWFRPARAAELGLHDAQPVFYGTEAWPGGFPRDEGACLFFDNTNSADLYQNPFWEHTVGPAFLRWRERLAGCGLCPLAPEPPNMPLFTQDHKTWNSKTSTIAPAARTRRFTSICRRFVSWRQNATR